MVKIIGTKRMEGTSKKSGKPYSGYMIWFVEQQQDVAGYAADSAFVSDTLLSGKVPAPDQNVDLRYNKNGYLQDIYFG